MNFFLGSEKPRLVKGGRSLNPNGHPVGKWGTYIQNILEGTVSTVDLAGEMRILSAETAVVAAAATTAETTTPATSRAARALLIQIIADS